MSIDQEYKKIDLLFDALFPLFRSITGPGIEKSYDILSNYLPLEIFGVPSNTQVFDWITPQEWHCTSAILIGPDDEVICDIKDSNLHVINYSEAVDKKLSLDELQNHLHSLEHLPDAVPYVTSYYHRTWGFCLSHKKRQSLKYGSYHAKIESIFVNGRVPLAHSLLKGKSDREIVLSSYLCHPSLANNELSGPLVLLGLYDRLKKWPNRNHSFRFILNPETIGSLCYLSLYGNHLKEKMDAGIVLTCLGGTGSLSYKKSRLENTKINKLALHWLSRGENIAIRPFIPTSGSDERQFCSPGFNLPMSQFSRSVYGQYEGYHNSLDTKEFMTIDALINSINQLERFLFELDSVGCWENRLPYGEPQLGRRGLYPNINSSSTWGASSDDVFDNRAILEKILFILSYSDNSHDLIDIADKCETSVSDLIPIAHRLEKENILKFVGGI